jgi:ribosomal protein L37E
VWGVMIAVEVASQLKLEGLARESESKVNYSLDPLHCGRCGYDLTANATGVCSECGWELPKLPIRLQNPVWHVWWREPTIEYLETPDLTFRMMAAAAVISSFGVALAGLFRLWGVSLFCLAGAVFCWVNVRRVAAYRKTLAAKT